MGDKVYHELTMTVEGLSKSYLIKQSRSELNKSYHIERTPGKSPDEYINFISTLSDHIRQLLTEKPELKDNKIEVKLSGDGAKMFRTTNFMLM